MKELTNVLRFLAEDVFNDDRSRVYVFVDHLDEHWVEDQFRYLLIRSLIETVRDFFQVKNVKIIVVLRSDLLEQVFRRTRDSGFQEEKYRSLYLILRWTKSQLIDLLDRRINHLVRQTYVKAPVTHKDLLTFKVSKQLAIDYMLSRTSMRPRELIEFFNCCIECADGKATITKSILFSAEGRYSKYRLRSLQDEWISEYPGLIEFAHILRGRRPQFCLSEIDKEQVTELCLSYAVEYFGRTDHLSISARSAAESGAQTPEFLRVLFHAFYRTGIVGLRTASTERAQWSFAEESGVLASTIDEGTRAYIHPMYFRALGTASRGDGSEEREATQERGDPA
jgi:hypothetical protein